MDAEAAADESSRINPPTTEGIAGELVPINQVGGGIRTIENLWHYCSENIQKALQNIQNTDKELLESDPQDIRDRIAAIEGQLRSLPQQQDFRKIIEDVDMPPTLFYQTFLANVSANQLGKKTMRGFFERLGALKQCEYAARYCGRPSRFWTTCYICGGGPIKGSGYECEHIVAAFSAIGHHGLIQSSIQLNQDDIEFYYYEYANAHVCCNQIKSDIKWIIYNPASGSYVIDEESLTDTLKKIWKSKLYDCKPRKGLPGQNISLPQFIRERAAYIIPNFLTPLLAKINNSKNSKGEAYHLLVRARQLNALNLSYTDIARALLGGEPLGRAAPKIQELVFTTAETIQLHYLNQLNRDMGSIYVEILMGIVGVVESPITRLELIKRVLGVNARMSARHPEATIKQHVEDPNRATSRQLKEIRDGLITESMKALEIGAGISETALNIQIANALSIFREGIFGNIMASVNALAPTLGINPALFSTCRSNSARGEATGAIATGGKRVKRHSRMIGGALAVNPALFAATPLGFNNPFAYDDGQGGDDRTAGVRATAASVAAPVEVMRVYKGTVKPIDEVYVSRSGRIVKPIIYVEYGRTATEIFVGYKGKKYAVMPTDEPYIMTTRPLESGANYTFDIFGDFRDIKTWEVEDPEGHRYKVQAFKPSNTGGRGGRGGKRIRRTIRKDRKGLTQRRHR